MRAALPLGAVDDANATLHDAIVAILMGALALVTTHLGFVELLGPEEPDVLSMVWWT